MSTSSGRSAVTVSAPGSPPPCATTSPRPVSALATDDAHGVYEKVGFKPLRNPEKWMYLRLDVVGSV